MTNYYVKSVASGWGNAGFSTSNGLLAQDSNGAGNGAVTY